MAACINPNSTSLSAWQQKVLYGEQSTDDSTCGMTDPSAIVTNTCAPGTALGMPISTQVPSFNGVSGFDGAACHSIDGAKQGRHHAKVIDEVAQATNTTSADVWQKLASGDSDTVSKLTTQLAADFTQKYAGISASDASLMATTSVQQLQQRASSAHHGVKATIDTVAQASSTNSATIWQRLANKDPDTITAVTNQLAADFTAQYPGISSDDAKLMATSTVNQVQQRIPATLTTVATATSIPSSTVDPTQTV